MAEKKMYAEKNVENLFTLMLESVTIFLIEI